MGVGVIQSSFVYIVYTFMMVLENKGSETWMIGRKGQVNLA